MLISDVVACSLPAWYPQFEKVTIQTEIIPLPQLVLEYFLEDGQLVLPSECNKEQSDGQEDDYEYFGDVDWNSEQNTDPSAEQKSFPEFSAQVTSILNQFGGEMFCKLNWSSPKDATWIGFNNSLKCTSLSQLYLLLKSSDFVTNDLTMPFKFCEDIAEEMTTPSLQYCLVLRQWIDVNPGMEFRCFVKNKDIVAISQRDNTAFYDHIMKNESSIKQDIFTFFKEHIQNKFNCDNYVFDVIRSKKDKVILVDFNPFGETTDALFFTWEELKSWNSHFEFRYATDSSGVQPHPYRHYSIPRDFVDLGSGSDPDKLKDFLRLQQGANSEQEQQSDSDSD